MVYKNTEHTTKYGIQEYWGIQLNMVYKNTEHTTKYGIREYWAYN